MTDFRISRKRSRLFWSKAAGLRIAYSHFSSTIAIQRRLMVFPAGAGVKARTGITSRSASPTIRPR
ncbi:MAG: hypothetical protein NT006_11760 [Candidatus Aminicenantes bacterium]|nr:hypothetical protein [Candidatus Aminicenantes bacterium]